MRRLPTVARDASSALAARHLRQFSRGSLATVDAPMRIGRHGLEDVTMGLPSAGWAASSATRRPALMAAQSTAASASGRRCAARPSDDRNEARHVRLLLSPGVWTRSRQRPGWSVPSPGPSRTSSLLLEHSGSVCTCEQLTGTAAGYACPEDHDHECQPSPYRHTPASTSGQEAEQTARPDCGSTGGGRTGGARSKAAANVFTIPLDGEGEAASSGGQAVSAR